MISSILLSGGTGSRMQNQTPKQYLKLKDKYLFQYSLELLLSHTDEVIVVAAPEFHPLFSPYPVKFAMPGARRQDSVYNGLKECLGTYVCIHDAARPFLLKDDLLNVIKGAKEVGSATLGVPLKFTIKECDTERFVKKTPDRSHLWEIQTPQVIGTELLKKGFHQAPTVTDDVSLVELMGHPVKVVLGSDSNIKITTPEDLAYGEYYIRRLSHTSS